MVSGLVLLAVVVVLTVVVCRLSGRVGRLEAMPAAGALAGQRSPSTNTITLPMAASEVADAIWGAP